MKEEVKETDFTTKSMLMCLLPIGNYNIDRTSELVDLELDVYPSGEPGSNEYLFEDKIIITNDGSVATGNLTSPILKIGNYPYLKESEVFFVGGISVPLPDEEVPKVVVTGKVLSLKNVT